MNVTHIKRNSAVVKFSFTGEEVNDVLIQKQNACFDSGAVYMLWFINLFVDAFFRIRICDKDYERFPESGCDNATLYLV